MGEIPLKRQLLNNPSQDIQPTRETRDTQLSYYTRENIRQNITHLYGEGIFQATRTFEKLWTKKTRLLCDLAFLRHCRDQELIPNFCKLKFHTHNNKISRILRYAGSALVRERIQDTRKRLDDNDQLLYRLRLRLNNIIHPSLWTQVDRLAEFRSQNDATIRTERQIAKISKLKSEQQTKSRSTPQENPILVHNLSDKTLSQAAEKVLAKGFNFAVTPKVIPIENIISGVENAISHMDSEIAESIRQETTSILRKARPPKKNLSGEEFQALQDLRKDTSIIILPADKGNATVVLNAVDYQAKIQSLLDDPSYKAITTDPTTYLEKTTKTLIKASPIDDEIKKIIIPREKSSRCPKLYGLPKIHKQGAPLRPIVSSVGSPTQALAKYLATTLQPFVEQTESYVKNSHHLIEIIKTLKLEENDILVSFDVTSLFTQVPVLEALSIIERKYNPPEHIINLAKHCLNNTYFIYGNQRYKQIEGAPMGSPLSPALANLFMEHFETTALQAATLKPKIWLRYVDDTLVVWQHGEENLNLFLNHLNQHHPKIKFTMEKEQTKQLPFLDVLLQRKIDGSLSHTVYRKPTHTNRYLHAESHHHPAQLSAVAKSLVFRSQALTDEENLEKEMVQLQQALTLNGYKKNILQQALRKPQKREKTEEAKAFLPYVKGTTDKIGKLLKKHNITTVFKTDRKIKDILPSAKDKIPLEDQGVYEIPCGDCNLSYVGQTNRRISTRKDEHINAVRQKTITSSLFQHVTKTGHKINFAKTRTLARSNNLSTRIIREAIEIEKRPINLNNRDDSQRLPTAWKNILTKCRIKPKNNTEPEAETIQKTPARITRRRTRLANPNQPIRTPLLRI